MYPPKPTSWCPRSRPPDPDLATTRFFSGRSRKSGKTTRAFSLTASPAQAELHQWSDVGKGRAPLRGIRLAGIFGRHRCNGRQRGVAGEQSRSAPSQHRFVSSKSRIGPPANDPVVCGPPIGVWPKPCLLHTTHALDRCWVGHPSRSRPRSMRRTLTGRCAASLVILGAAGKRDRTRMANATSITSQDHSRSFAGELA